MQHISRSGQRAGAPRCIGNRKDVCELGRLTIQFPLSAFFTADSAPWNPMRLCGARAGQPPRQARGQQGRRRTGLDIPDKGGRVTDPPQRQRENAGFPVKSYLLPSASISSTEPSAASTRYGPFFLTVILTAAMKPSPNFGIK